MKIAGRIFRKNKIRTNTDTTFCAGYKGCCITVTTNHGHGKPKYDHLQRYDITVTDERGCYLVNDWQDKHEIRYAIIYALEGAEL